MDTYTVRDADSETARRIARFVTEHSDLVRVEARALGAAARAEDAEALETVAGDVGAGYFEVEVEADDDAVDAVVSLLPSLTRAVFIADRPVFARYDDGQIFLRVDDETAKGVSDFAEMERATFDDSAEVAFDVEEGEE